MSSVFFDFLPVFATYLFLFGTPLLGFAIYQRKRYVRIKPGQPKQKPPFSG
jgi:hypothetical protein